MLPSAEALLRLGDATTELSKPLPDPVPGVLVCNWRVQTSTANGITVLFVTAAPRFAYPLYTPSRSAAYEPSGSIPSVSANFSA